ncbi:MAG: branched-chain amino acid transport system II carrier protein [Mobilicoccus sp.]|nr:branched-chain amino acid transport system II carrier protein [Mobilicoccus sp.]
MSTQVPGTAADRSRIAVLATAMMLFAMFFGAGNLIFPPMLGAQAGEAFTPAIVGFLLGGVLLPVLTITAVVISGSDVRDLARRGGRVFAVAFPVVVYLSIGAFYGLPRTGAVSFSTAVSPVTGWTGTTASVLFNLVFFAVALVLAFNPGRLIDSLGKILTPALLLLLVVLVALSVATLGGRPGSATPEYAANPVGSGLLEGYMTMDSVAALAFGIVVISSLKSAGITERGQVVRGTIAAGFIAGGLLAAIYVGLGLIGQFIPGGPAYTDGARLLSDAAGMTMGSTGRLVFGAIVLLACLTTAVGLLAASAEFFHRLVPALSYRVWLGVFAVVAFAIASVGLETMLALAAPVIGFIYPVAITVVFVTLATPLLRPLVDVRWGFLVAGWTATVWSLLVLLGSLGIATQLMERLTTWTPWQAANLGWVLPTLIAFAVGVGIDLATGRSETPADAPARQATAG